MLNGGARRNWQERICTSVIGLTIMTCGTAALAAAPDSPVTHPMAAEGIRAYEAGRFAEANEKLSRALDAIGVPAMALYAARSNVRLNHFVKAAELYGLATRLTPANSANIAQLQAQHEAERERAELLTRVPRLTITLEGEDLDKVEVSLDADPVPKALLGANQLVDPGHHVIIATRDGQLVTGHLDIGEKQHRTTTLHFARREPANAASQILPTISSNTERLNLLPNASPESPPDAYQAARSPLFTNARDKTPSSTVVTSVARTGGAKDTAHRDAATEDHDNLQRILGWTGIGVGAAGLLVGTTAGLLAVSKRSELESAGCRSSTCYADSSAEVDSYNAMRTWSTIGFVTASLFGVTGITLLITAPKAEEPAPVDQRLTDVRLGVAPGATYLFGRF